MMAPFILCLIVYGLSNGEDHYVLALAIVLILIVFATTTFLAYKDGKSESTLDEIELLKKCTVLRNN